MIVFRIGTFSAAYFKWPLPTLGWIITALAVGGALGGLLVMHDWPPFMSYIILLVVAVGLMRPLA